ncbi:MAG: DUF1015 domain-containing protein [Sedimentisphaerales bacterium]
MEIKPFRALRFDPKVVGDAGKCIAPPFDVIGPAEQQQLYEKSEYNIVRIIRGKTTASDNDSNNQYTRAADYLNRWIKDGALKQDSDEAIYAYVQDFQLANTTFQRLSFIALARLEEFGKTVRPHEQTFDGPMIDRLNLKRATAAQFGLVSMLYEDQQKIAEKIIKRATTEKPCVDFCDDQNIRHRLFIITSREDIDVIAKMMSDKSCTIADGHHRYVSGLTYSKQNANLAAKYQMLAFTNICQEAVKLLATHRLVSTVENFDFEKFITSLKENFALIEFPFDSPDAKVDAKQKMLAQMKSQQGSDKNAFGIYGGNNAFYVAVLKDKQTMDSVAPNYSDAWKSLDVSVLHKLILEKLLGVDEQKLVKGQNLEYVKDASNAIDGSLSRIDAGQKQVLFLMNPVKMQQLKIVTEAGERMPPKSTYFYPKMYTGLVIQKL